MKKRIESHQLESLIKRITKLGYEQPSDVKEHERPDFVLTISGRRIGVEVTAAVYQEHVRAQKLHIQRCPTECVNTTNLQDRDPRRSNDELMSEMLKPNGTFKDSEQDMCDWRDKVATALERKRAKLGHPDFQLFHQNWLLIHDEPGLANDRFTCDRAWQHAAALFSVPFVGARDFDTTFLLSNRYLFHWHQQVLSLHYEPSKV